MKKQVKIEINITNKAFYTLIAIGILLVMILSVWAYQSNMRAGNPLIMGHSAGEIYVENSAGEIISLQDALDNLTNSLNRRFIAFEVYNPDTKTYACVDKDLKDLCGDEDGCDIRLELQHETDSSDQVKTIDEHIFMEQPDMSNNRSPGIYGYTRQEGGGDFSWITGTEKRYTIFSPWGWMWMLNYRSKHCPEQSGKAGPAWSDPYKFTFVSSPKTRTRVIIYD